ncbi:hypothetical protein GAMM_170059 [Gammaproteobacteria bacterium]
MQPEIRLAQAIVLRKLKRYLDLSERDPEFFKGFEYGYCAGLSSLWAYSKWLQTQKKDTDLPRDDYDWFKSTIDSIANWDEETYSNMTPEMKQNLDRFISLIELFQLPFSYLPIAGQLQLDKTLEDVKQKAGEESSETRHPTKEYSIASVFTLDQLNNLLQIPDIIQEGKMILVASPNHATAIFKQGGNYFYFDPNSETGEVKCANTKKLAELVFKAYHTDPLSLSLTMQSMDTKKGAYPSVKEVLDKIKPKDEASYVSGLIMAAKANCLESVHYFLEKIKDNKEEENTKNVALLSAIPNNSIDAIKLLLDAGANPGIPIKAGADSFPSAFNLAMKKGNEEIIKMFIEKINDPFVLTDGFEHATAGNRATAIGILLEKQNSVKLNKLLNHISEQKDINIKTIAPLIEAIGPEMQEEELSALVHNNGNVELIKFLVKKGISPDKTSKDSGKTALEYALNNNDANLVELLVNNSYDLAGIKKYLDEKRHTSVEIDRSLTIRKNSLELLENLEKDQKNAASKIDALDKKGIDDLLGNALVIAASRDSAVIPVIMEKATEQAKKIALTKAIEQNLTKAIEVLLGAGVNPNLETTNSKFTALELAIHNKNVDAMIVIAEGITDIPTLTNALFYATKNFGRDNYREAIEILIAGKDEELIKGIIEKTINTNVTDGSREAIIGTMVGKVKNPEILQKAYQLAKAKNNATVIRVLEKKLQQTKSSTDMSEHLLQLEKTHKAMLLAIRQHKDEEKTMLLAIQQYKDVLGIEIGEANKIKGKLDSLKQEKIGTYTPEKERQILSELQTWISNLKSLSEHFKLLNEDLGKITPSPKKNQEEDLSAGLVRIDTSLADLKEQYDTYRPKFEKANVVYTTANNKINELEKLSSKLNSVIEELKKYQKTLTYKILNILSIGFYGKKIRNEMNKVTKIKDAISNDIGKVHKTVDNIDVNTASESKDKIKKDLNTAVDVQKRVEEVNTI